MATSYTYPIEDDDSYLFDEFLWQCARAFGPLDHMRDSAFNAEIKPPVASDYYLEKMQQANREYTRLSILSLEEAAIELDKQYKADLASTILSIETYKVKRRRYQNMMDKVEAWNPPTPDHFGLKNFMIQQLKMELDSDRDYYSHRLKEEKPTPQQWLQDNLRYTEEDMKRASKRFEDEQEHIRFATKWINQLQESVPFPEKSK